MRLSDSFTHYNLNVPFLSLIGSTSGLAAVATTSARVAHCTHTGGLFSTVRRGTSVTKGSGLAVRIAHVLFLLRQLHLDQLQLLRVLKVLGHVRLVAARRRVRLLLLLRLRGGPTHLVNIFQVFLFLVIVFYRKRNQPEYKYVLYILESQISLASQSLTQVFLAIQIKKQKTHSKPKLRTQLLAAISIGDC